MVTMYRQTQIHCVVVTSPPSSLPLTYHSFPGSLWIILTFYCSLLICSNLCRHSSMSWYSPMFEHWPSIRTSQLTYSATIIIIQPSSIIQPWHSTLDFFYLALISHNIHLLVFYIYSLYLLVRICLIVLNKNSFKSRLPICLVY